MKLYKLECLNPDGTIECNGYFLDRKNAEQTKVNMDSWHENIEYGIKQNIIEIETVD